jgi:hypothetical protein
MTYGQMTEEELEHVLRSKIAILGNLKKRIKPISEYEDAINAVIAANHRLNEFKKRKRSNKSAA